LIITNTKEDFLRIWHLVNASLYVFDLTLQQHRYEEGITTILFLGEWKETWTVFASSSDLHSYLGQNR
jgi:hypothetical protein